jgi:two-component system sensor histidine kinase KdpD
MDHAARPARQSPRESWHLAAGIAGAGLVTGLHRLVLHVTNPTVIGLSFLLVVLFVSAVSTLRVAVAISFVAVLAYNYFFMPPVGTFTIEEPANWVALFTFLAVSIVASRLSLLARMRADEATLRRDEMGRLFDLSRDVLLTSDSPDGVGELVQHMARRFSLEHVAVCLPSPEGWQVHESSKDLVLDRGQLDLAIAAARGTLEFDAESRSYGGHRHVTGADGVAVTLVPLRLGGRAVGLLATAGRSIEPGTLDTVAGLTAIAIERAKLLEERRASALIQQRAELRSALLASLGHDLRTPLTAISVAANNLRASFLEEEQRREQLDVVLAEVERLNRLFENIVDMARIETGAVSAEREWVSPADIVDAAVSQVEHALRDHALEIDVAPDLVVQVDPRLTSATLAHVLENAGHYAPPGSKVTVSVRVNDDGLLIAVRDRGPGIASEDREHLFERFYRGAGARGRAFGTGMGLAITRGLLAAQQGRVWADNDPEGGAVFTMTVPAQSRVVAAVEPETE